MKITSRFGLQILRPHANSARITHDARTATNLPSGISYTSALVDIKDMLCTELMTHFMGKGIDKHRIDLCDSRSRAAITGSTHCIRSQVSTRGLIPEIIEIWSCAQRPPCQARIIGRHQHVANIKLT